MFYVLCDKNCKYEAMTKEQTLAAITQAVETGEIKDVDTGFVTKIKEKNSGAGLSFWIGTEAEYNAISEKVNNCFYIITDDTTEDSLDVAIGYLSQKVEAIENELGNVKTVVSQNGKLLCKPADSTNLIGEKINNINDYMLFAVDVEGKARVVCTKAGGGIAGTGTSYISGNLLVNVSIQFDGNGVITGVNSCCYSIVGESIVNVGGCAISGIYGITSLCEV